MIGDGDGLLTPDEQQVLLRLARNTLQRFVLHQRVLTLPEPGLPPRLTENRGAFVTLRADGRLRGCVGYPAHRSPLARTVVNNTINAASRDPRFQPVTPPELPDIAIEISVLSRGDTPESPYRRVRDIHEIVIGRHGLYLEHPDGLSGLLLPQVPVEQQWTVEQFLEGLCFKAGLAGDGWRSPDAELFSFTAEVFSEVAMGV